MTSDVYQLCPGGTGKKLKFCCADLVNEIPKLERMIQGEQRLACLDQIERLEQKHPDRACLLSLKLMIQSALGQGEEFVSTVRQFSQAHPQNSIALSQEAVLAAREGNYREAVALLNQAMEHCPEAMSPLVYIALGSLSELLLAGQEVLPALAIVRSQTAMASQDAQAQQLLTSVERAASLPLLLRDDTYPELEPPQDQLGVPRQRESYARAMHALLQVSFAKSIALLEELAAEAPQTPVVWRSLGYLRAFALDNQGAIDALRRFSALATGDDAVEAEALAQLLASADDVDHLVLEYAVIDADQVASSLASSAQTLELPVDPRMVGEGEPPPRGVYAILDRPKTEDIQASADDLPFVLGRGALFGKQTDREARLLISASRWELDRVQSLLAQWLPHSLGAAGEPEAVFRQKLSNELLRVELQMPRGLAPQRSLELQSAVLAKRLDERWLNRPLVALDGKSPLEAAGDPALNLRVRASFLNLELDLEAAGERVDLEPFRQQLRLPAPAVIDPRGLKVEQLPLPRLRRLDFAVLDDSQLTVALERAVTFDIRLVTRQAAAQAINRPDLLAKLGADRVYFIAANACDDPEEAIKHLSDGRAAAQHANHSTMIFDLRELEVRVGERNIPEIERMLNVVLRQHGAQPGVQEAVASMLMQAGMMPSTAAPPGAAPLGEPPSQSAAESGGIWTPDAERPAAQKSSIWTPGMD